MVFMRHPFRTIIDSPINNALCSSSFPRFVNRESILFKLKWLPAYYMRARVTCIYVLEKKQ